MPQITLYFLQASRSIRTAWLLEELGLDYEVKFAPRENGAAPSWIKEEIGGLGKFPALKDGGLLLFESGNITGGKDYRSISYGRAISADATQNISATRTTPVIACSQP